ncbi:DUF4440 domain-containing protein [Cronobacter sakazakii]|nr:DUF4440 domain-containing protein [Cronobacter sakazakii]ELQ6210015.1 DUF4440 domain-containing protein [Cronobacter sakazakii]ELY6376066.1 DUF4440 domain-containing protein [Cronobacter sakazakii]ELZ3958565.1 DUF4440 domain-containing protein [Cronobacter sakazakii]
MLLERLTTLEQSLHGDQRRDRDWLEYLLHPQFCEVTRSGVLVSRDETIDALTQETGTAFIVSDGFTLLSVNAGSAILRYRTCTAEGQRPAWRASHWVRVDEARWQLIFHQGTPAV